MQSLIDLALLGAWYVVVACVACAAGYVGGKLIFVNPAKRKPVRFFGFDREKGWVRK